MSSNNSRQYLESNIAALTRKYPSFKTDIIDNYPPVNDLTFSDTPEGGPAARLDGIWLHSSRAPVREAQRLIDSGIKNKNGLCLVYGFGLGYHIEELLKRCPDMQILIIEPEPGLFLKALEARDFRTLIESGRTGFLLASPATGIPRVLGNFRTRSIQSIMLRSLYNRNAEYFDSVEQEVKSFIHRRDTNMNTLTRFGRTWTRNLFSNIETFKRARDAGNWYGAFEGIPALVIAAGPSLDELLPILPELRERFILICVDTALRAVLQAGAVPDFIAVVDPQYLNTRHLDRLLDTSFCPGAVVIAESSTHPAVFRSCSLPVCFYKSVFPLGKLIGNLAGISSELGAGGSVSTTAWDFARRTGADRIYTAGLDLGFTDKRTHCRTSLSSFLAQLGSSRLSGLETVNFFGMHGASPFPATSNNDEEVITDARLIIYKSWFEGQINAAGLSDNSAQFYNLSGSGVKIEGMPYYNQADMMNEPVCREEIDLMKSSIDTSGDNPHYNAEAMSELLKTIETECSRLESICNEALDILENDGDRRGIEKLSELDERILRSPSKELTGFIIQPVLNDIIDKDGDVMENSRALYSSLSDACSYYRIQAARSRKQLIRR